MDIKEIQRCKNCGAWDAKGTSIGKGLCRINPPMANKDGCAVWPRTHEEEWCWAFRISQQDLERLKASSIVGATSMPVVQPPR